MVNLITPLVGPLVNSGYCVIKRMRDSMFDRQLHDNILRQIIRESRDIGDDITAREERMNHWI
jgi:hypothetical protein